MSKPTLSELVTAALVEALGPVSATSLGARETATNEADVEKMLKKGHGDIAAPRAEKCYGVALKGQNDLRTAVKTAAGTTCAGTTTIDDQGGDFRLEPDGTCLTLKMPNRVGGLTPKA